MHARAPPFRGPSCARRRGAPPNQMRGRGGSPHRLRMSTSAFLQTRLEKRRPIPRMAVMAYMTFCLPSTLVLSTRRMCWNSSPARRDCAGAWPPGGRGRAAVKHTRRRKCGRSGCGCTLHRCMFSRPRRAAEARPPAMRARGGGQQARRRGARALRRQPLPALQLARPHFPACCSQRVKPQAPRWPRPLALARPWRPPSAADAGPLLPGPSSRPKLLSSLPELGVCGRRLKSPL
jgi:hypothetical protein